MKIHFRFGIHILQILCLMTMVLIISCKPESSKPKEILQNYGTGELARRFTEINHKKEGLMTDYYIDGKLKAERTFENDVQVGKTIIYYPSGKIKEVQYYQDGKIFGGDTVFYEDGRPQFVVTFANGLKNGYVRKWGEDGNLYFEARYSNDSLVEVKGEAINPDSIPHLLLNSPADMKLIQ